MELQAAALRPGQINERLDAQPIVFLPMGPLEWHGPHLPMGTDPINAERMALAVCEKIGGVVWPTLWWGTERERPPETLRHLGFSEEDYVVGMDFPGITLPSAYCHEGLWGLVVRETLRLISRWDRVRLISIINGHGAVNHNDVLRRLVTEHNQDPGPRVCLDIALSKGMDAIGAIGHADAAETSLMMHYAPETVDLTILPPAEEPMHYKDFGIVNGFGFIGKGHPDKIVEHDPRTEASPQKGREVFEDTLQEITTHVRHVLADLPTV